MGSNHNNVTLRSGDCSSAVTPNNESVDVSVILDRIGNAQDQLFDHLRTTDDVIRRTFTQQRLLNYLRHQQLLDQLLSILSTTLSTTLPDFVTLRGGDRLSALRLPQLPRK